MNITQIKRIGVRGAEPYRITEKPYYVANQYNEGFGFVKLKIDDKRLDGTFFDIGLNCKMEITQIMKWEVIRSWIIYTNNDKQ